MSNCYNGYMVNYPAAAYLYTPENGEGPGAEDRVLDDRRNVLVARLHQGH